MELLKAKEVFERHVGQQVSNEKFEELLDELVTTKENKDNVLKENKKVLRANERLDRQVSK